MFGILNSLCLGFLNSFSALITILTFYGIIFEVGDRFYNMSCADSAAAIPSPCQRGPRQMSKNHAVSHACQREYFFRNAKCRCLFSSAHSKMSIFHTVLQSPNDLFDQQRVLYFGVTPSRLEVHCLNKIESKIFSKSSNCFKFCPRP